MPREKRPSPEGKVSNRQEFKEMRRRRQRNQRIIAIGAIALFVGLFLLAVVPPVYRQITATPLPVVVPDNPARPMVSDNAMGDPNAPVKIEEFSDYQCPGCKSFADQVERQIVETYVVTGKVYFVYRTMDIWVGPESREAGEAAYCAGEQGKYWEYHDILFANWNGENQGAFSGNRLETFAEKIGLDSSAFRSCVAGDKFLPRLKEDRAAGEAYGVTGTPSFVINGQLAQIKSISFSELQAVIEAALAAAGK